MALFLGEFEHQIDDKGRLSIPSRFREQCLEEPTQTLAIFAGFDPCLYIMPLRALEELRTQLNLAQTEWNDVARALRLKLFSLGNTGKPDAQGRIYVSDKQKQYAGLDRRVMVVGNLERIEVWDVERYQEHLGKPEAASVAMGDLASMLRHRSFPETRER